MAASAGEPDRWREDTIAAARAKDPKHALAREDEVRTSNAELRLAFHAMRLECSAMRAAGWDVQRSTASALRPASRPTLARVQTGIGLEKARACMARLPALPVSGAVLGGFAGALRPDLPRGAVVIGDPVLDANGERWKPPLADALESAARDAGLVVVRGPLVSVSHVVGDRAAKQALAARTGAIAVDMESAALAEALAARGVPFAAARVVLDTAGETVALAAGGGFPTARAVADGLRMAANIPGCARISARLLEAWLRGAGCREP